MHPFGWEQLEAAAKSSHTCVSRASGLLCADKDQGPVLAIVLAELTAID